MRGVSLRLERGTLTVVTGRVGSGKTTLLRVLLGLLPKQAGEVRYNGQMVEEPAVFFRPPYSSYTAQVPTLVSGTLQENILMGMPAEQADVEMAVSAAVLEQDLPGLEHGLQTQVGARGVKLSGGQAQRTAAARMFVRRSELLVLDDLSSSLDVRTEALLWERLRARGGQTALAVSTRRGALGAADQIIVLKDGEVEAVGTVSQLLERSAEFRAIWYGAEAELAG